MKTFEGIYNIKGFKNDHGKCYPFTIDADSEDEAVKELRAALNKVECYSYSITRVNERK